jgi:succinate dehydrogenase / fumarate reductase, cytochrome b subunit
MATNALTITDTTIGKKAVMAVSGLVLFGFVIVHMLGNLQIFLGPTIFNQYSQFLHASTGVLWGTRAVLAIAVLAHIVTSAQLYLRNKTARPSRYKVKKNLVTSYAARVMYLSGPLLLLYIVYHIAHLTLGVTTGLGYEHAVDAQGSIDVYQNVVASFRVPWLAGIYVMAQILLGLHIYHGAWSLFQSLGINHRRYNEPLRNAASALALATVAGFLAVPIGVYAGWVV